MNTSTTRLERLRERIATGVLALLGARLIPVPEPSGTPSAAPLSTPRPSLTPDDAERLIAADPAGAGAEAYAVRASVLIQNGFFTDAVSILDQILGAPSPVMPPNLASQIYSTRALAYLSLRHDKEAAGDLAIALRLDPANIGALQLRGTLRALLRDLAGAEADYMAVYRLRPGAARSVSNLAWLRLLHRDEDVAFRLAQDALGRDERDAVAHYVIGVFYAGRKQRREAVSAYRRALAAWPNPESPQAQPYTEMMRAYIERWEDEPLDSDPRAVR